MRFEGLRKLTQDCSVFSVIRWLFGIRPVSVLRQDKVSPSRSARGYRNSRLHKQVGRIEVTPSRRLEVIGSKGRAVFEEHHGARSVLEPAARRQLREDDS